MNGSVQDAERLSFLRRSTSTRKAEKCIALGLVIITGTTRRARNRKTDHEQRADL